MKKRKRKKKEEIYEITPLGLFATVTTLDVAKAALVALELYCLRNGYNGLVLTGPEEFEFCKLEKDTK